MQSRLSLTDMLTELTYTGLHVLVHFPEFYPFLSKEWERTSLTRERHTKQKRYLHTSRH